MDNEILVKSIRNLCNGNGISVSQLEKKLNFGAGLISRWAKSDPSLSKIVDIAKYFNVSLDEVVGYKIKEPQKEFIDIVYEKTICKELQWNDISDDIDNLADSDDCYFENYDGDYRELFVAEFEDSEFIIYSDYNKEQGIIEDMDIQFFIKPDGWTEPVIQNIIENKKYKLWEFLHSYFYESPAEYKAKYIQEKFVEQNEENPFTILIEKHPNNIAHGKLVSHYIEAIEKAANIDSREINNIYKLVSSSEFKQLTSKNTLETIERLRSILSSYYDILDDNNKRAGD